MRSPPRALPASPDEVAVTELRRCPALARRLGVSSVYLKLESERPLGNFKFLGGYVATIEAVRNAVATSGVMPEVVCASDGNHGLAVAAGARKAGAAACVYLPADVDPRRVQKIAAEGARTVSLEGTYDMAVTLAKSHASGSGALLIADTGDDPDDPFVARVMEGYRILVSELCEQFRGFGEFPTHAYVQAGVGGLAAAVAEGLTPVMEGPRTLCIVEPSTAACVAMALKAGRPVQMPGELRTSASMLSCGLASAAALQVLKHHRTLPVMVDDDILAQAVSELGKEGVETTASGAAGFAGFLTVTRSRAARRRHGLAKASRILLIVTERPIEGPGFCI